MSHLAEKRNKSFEAEHTFLTRAVQILQINPICMSFERSPNGSATVPGLDIGGHSKGSSDKLQLSCFISFQASQFGIEIMRIVRQCQ